MKVKAPLSIGLLLAGSVLASRAYACNVLDQQITDTSKPTVAVFDENGKFQREIPKADVIKKKVTGCNESLGLVKVDQADGKSIWLDLIEIKIPTAVASAGTQVCVAKSNAKDSDTRQIVSSGAEPEQKSCAAK